MRGKQAVKSLKHDKTLDIQGFSFLWCPRAESNCRPIA